MLGRTFVSLTDLIAAHARGGGERPAVVHDGRRVTWAELSRSVSRYADGLRAAGVRPGERVAILALNSIETWSCCFGALAAGAVLAPLSPLLPPALLAKLLEDCSPSALIADRTLRPLADAAVQAGSESLPRFGLTADVGWPMLPSGSSDGPHHPGPDDLFNIIYSSGTTGAPKGVVHDHLARAEHAVGLALEFGIDRRSVTLVTTPPFTNGTWMTVLPTVAAGGCIVLTTRFDPAEFLDVLRNEAVTHAFVVPTQIAAVVECLGERPLEAPGLKRLISAGAALPRGLKATAATLTGGRLMELYGLTEGLAATLQPADLEAQPASVGRPAFGVELRVVGAGDVEVAPGEIGEIVGRSSGLMRGYWRRPDATQEALWRATDGQMFFRTGDMGRMDAEGFLFVTDRKKDMIVSGGINVYAADLEEALLGHPSVRDCAVIGVAHDKWGETPLALVIPSETPIDEAALREFANVRLGKHQRISRILFRGEDFPRNALGKVLKVELRRQYANSVSG